jgi:oxygen-dependent protoporphyrinogen oxidase
MPDGLNLMVPTNLAALEASPLFTTAAIAAYRAEPARAAELLASIPPDDESVADFTLRHFGREVLDRLAAPLLSGVFGGDVRTLSVRAVMPAFVRMERTHGSLITALSRTSNPEPRTSSLFTTLRTGLAALIERLVANIPPQWLRLNTSVTAIEPAISGQPSSDAPPWTLHTRTTTGKHYGSETFDAIFLATPLDAARRLLTRIDATAAELLPTESSSAVLVAFAYDDASRVPLPPGFGFLVPPAKAGLEEAIDPSRSLLLACTFADQKFPHRVPPNGRLIRAFFGGAAADRLELARILNANAPVSGPAPTPAPVPALTVVRRWPNSLPQYAVGHLIRVAELESRLRAHPGLILLGNALHGVGLPDLIRDARGSARAAATNHGEGTIGSA